MTTTGLFATRLGLSLFALLVMLCAARSIGAVDARDDQSTRPPGRNGHMASVVDGMIYVTGGSAAALNAGQRLDVWNPRAGEWESLPAPQHERALGAMVSVATRIYLIGGLDSDGRTIDSIEIFNTATTAWEEAITDPSPASRHTAVAIGTTIYIIGGIDSSTVHSTQVRSLDTTTGAWTVHPPMKCGRHGHAAAVRDGKIVVTGGYALIDEDNSGQATSVEVFDPAANAWIPGPPLAKPHAFHGMANINGTLYAFGTRGDDRSLELLAPGADAWTPGAPMPAPRHRFGSAVVGNKLYIIDGEDERGNTRPSIMIYDTATDEWHHAEE